MASSRSWNTSVIYQDLGTRFECRNSGSENLYALLVGPVMKYPAVDINIGIFDYLWCKEVVLHELDVGALVFSFDAVSYIDVLDDDFESGICVSYGRACKSVCSPNLWVLVVRC